MNVENTSSKQVRELIETVAEFSDAIEENTRRTEELRTAHQSQRRILFWAGVTVVLIAVAVAVFIVIKDNTANSKIRANTEEIRTIQDRTSNEVLCPLYRLLVGSEPRAMSNPTLTEEQKVELRSQYAVIRQGYSALRCKDPS